MSRFNKVDSGATYTTRFDSASKGQRSADSLASIAQQLADKTGISVEDAEGRISALNKGKFDAQGSIRPGVVLQIPVVKPGWVPKPAATDSVAPVGARGQSANFAQPKVTQATNSSMPQANNITDDERASGFHELQYGDTLSQLAAAIGGGVTAAQLAEWNGLPDVSAKIYAGKRLRISAPEQPVNNRPNINPAAAAAQASGAVTVADLEQRIALAKHMLPSVSDQTRGQVLQQIQIAEQKLAELKSTGTVDINQTTAQLRQEIGSMEQELAGLVEFAQSAQSMSMSADSLPATVRQIQSLQQQIAAKRATLTQIENGQPASAAAIPQVAPTSTLSPEAQQQITEKEREIQRQLSMLPDRMAHGDQPSIDSINAYVQELQADIVAIQSGTPREATEGQSSTTEKQAPVSVASLQAQVKDLTAEIEDQEQRIRALGAGSSETAERGRAYVDELKARRVAINNQINAVETPSATPAQRRQALVNETLTPKTWKPGADTKDVDNIGFSRGRTEQHTEEILNTPDGKPIYVSLEDFQFMKSRIDGIHKPSDLYEVGANGLTAEDAQQWTQQRDGAVVKEATEEALLQVEVARQRTARLYP